jgi:hypothetical protein
MPEHSFPQWRAAYISQTNKDDTNFSCFQIITSLYKYALIHWHTSVAQGRKKRLKLEAITLDFLVEAQDIVSLLALAFLTLI